MADLGTALLSGGFGLFGALIGAFSAQIASRRTREADRRKRTCHVLADGAGHHDGDQSRHRLSVRARVITCIRPPRRINRSSTLRIAGSTASDGAGGTSASRSSTRFVRLAG